MHEEMKYVITVMIDQIQKGIKKKENIVDPNSQTFGMLSCLRVPIAVSDVRIVKDTIIGRDEVGNQRNCENGKLRN